MNGPFVVAQAGSNSANSTSSPVQIIKIIKPQAGQTEIFHASFTGTVKIDFTAIANEKITLFHDNKNQSLHIIFADGSQAIIEPFFDSMGVLSNFLLEMAPGQILNGAQFAAQFPITTDQSVLPAAGEGGEQASGANFSDPSVDALVSPEPLPLLPPEELPPIEFTETTPAALFSAEETAGSAPAVVGQLFGLVEEEQLSQITIVQPSDAGNGNEDINDVSGNDNDTSDSFPGDQNITHTISGTLAGLISGGSVTFSANSAANGATVKDSDGNDVRSIGEIVQYVFVNATTIEGWTSPGEGGRLIFTLHVNPDGSFTFMLNDQIDHLIQSHDDGTNPQGIFEETLNLDLSAAITAAAPDPVVFPPNTFDIGVIDDTPVTFHCVEDGEEITRGGCVVATLDDESLTNPNSPGIDGGPGDDGSDTSVSDFLSIAYGADGPAHFDGETGTNPLAFDPAKIVVTNDNGVQIPLSEFNAIFVSADGQGTQHHIDITWSDNAPGGGTLAGTAIGPDGVFDVFTLVVNGDGTYTFTTFAPLAHPFNVNGGSTEDPSRWEDNLQIEFTYTATDYDGDQVDGHLTISVDDDTPTVEGNLQSELPAIAALDESVGDDLSSPSDDNDTSDDTGAASPFGSATISAATIAGLFISQAGADGEGSHAYGFVLKDVNGDPASIGTTFVQTNLSATDNANIYADDTVYLEQVSSTQINGYVGAAENPANLALRFVIDPVTGEVTVEQYLAIHHDLAGSDAAAYDDVKNMFVVGEGEFSLGGIFVSYLLADGDDDSASAISDQPLSVTIDDDGLNVNIVDAPNSVVEAQAINGTWTLTQGTDGIASVEVTVGLTTHILSMAPLQSVSFGPADGAFGTLTVFSDGTWTYQAGSVSGAQAFSFTIKATDGDGDSSSDTLTISIDDSTTTLVQSSAFAGNVEEEQLGHTGETAYAASFTGNEDETASPDNDLDVSPNFDITTNVASNAFIVVGGTGPYTFHFAPGIEGTQAQFADAPFGMTSHGAPVLLHVDGDTLTGYTNVGAVGYLEGTDHVVFTFEIDSSSGAGTFTLFDNVDHHVTGDGIEGTRSLNLNGIVQVTDSSPVPQTLSLNGSVGIIDDIPVANGDTATVKEGGNGTTNFLLTIDTSASMGENPGVPGFATRLELEKAALINLLNAANVNQVFIVSFGTGAVNSGGWLSKAAAITFINGLTAFGLTNYDAALASTETAFTFAHTGADQTLSYFLSDGVPNLPFASPGINAAEQAIWENFLIANGVAQSFAVGVGNGVTVPALEPIAFPNGDPSNPVVITDQSQLTSTLIHSLPGTAEGNVLDNDSFGADGPGDAAGILSISVDGDLYAYDTGTNSITKNGVAFAPGTGTLDLDTQLGGHLTFHFTSGVGFLAGDWRYLSPADVTADTFETFHYVIADGDGDQIGADLTVTVTAVNDPPVANDDTVVTNIDGSGAAIVIPDLALLLNDVDPDGPTLTISSVGVPLSGAVAHVASTTTFTDDDLSGGSFDYTMQDGGVPVLSDTAHVTIDRSQAGDGQLDGTSASEILIGRAGFADTLVGGGGSDVQFGDTGDDHFRYNATSEGLDHILDFGSGNDILEFDHTAFGSGLAGGGLDTGTLDPSHFVANGTGATNADQKFWYNTNNYTLYFDADGNGAGAAIGMAKLENAHALASGEIHMV